MMDAETRVTLDGVTFVPQFMLRTARDVRLQDPFSGRFVYLGAIDLDDIDDVVNKTMIAFEVDCALAGGMG